MRVHAHAYTQELGGTHQHAHTNENEGAHTHTHTQANIRRKKTEFQNHIFQGVV